MRKPFLCCPSYDFGISQSKNVRKEKSSATEDYIMYIHTWKVVEAALSLKNKLKLIVSISLSVR
jgi:hypothetical protein